MPRNILPLYNNVNVAYWKIFCRSLCIIIEEVLRHCKTEVGMFRDAARQEAPGPGRDRLWIEEDDYG